MSRAAGGLAVAAVTVVVSVTGWLALTEVPRAPRPTTLPAEASGDIAFVHVNVISMVDERVREDQTVLVLDGQIALLGAAGRVEVRPDATRLDAHGLYLFPGLTDAHTHIAFEQDLLPYVANGVTTIVNLGHRPDVPIMRWRARVAAAELLGPTIFVARFVDGAGSGRGSLDSFLLRTPDQARAFVRETGSEGYDLIKAYNGLAADVYAALMEEADSEGIAVVGHGVRSVGLEGVLSAGQVMIAHAEEYLYTYFQLDTDRGRIPQAAGLTAEAGVFVVPNLSAYEAISRQWGRPEALRELLGMPQLRYTHPFWRRFWARGRYLSHEGDLSDELEFLRELTRALNDSGVPLLLGTDSPPIPGMLPGFSIHEDLRTLVESGLTPRDALRAGTRNAGEFVARHIPGSQRFGVIAPGYRADLLLLEENPLEKVEHLRHRAGVMIGGRWLSEERLQELMERQAEGLFGESDSGR